MIHRKCWGNELAVLTTNFHIASLGYIDCTCSTLGVGWAPGCCKHAGAVFARLGTPADELRWHSDGHPDGTEANGISSKPMQSSLDMCRHLRPSCNWVGFWIVFGSIQMVCLTTFGGLLLGFIWKSHCFENVFVFKSWISLPSSPKLVASFAWVKHETSYFFQGPNLGNLICPALGQDDLSQYSTTIDPQKLPATQRKKAERVAREIELRQCCRGGAFERCVVEWWLNGACCR